MSILTAVLADVLFWTVGSALSSYLLVTVIKHHD